MSNQNNPYKTLANQKSKEWPLIRKYANSPSPSPMLQQEIYALLQAYDVLKVEREDARIEVERLMGLRREKIDVAIVERDRYREALQRIERIQTQGVPEHVTNIGDRLRWVARVALEGETKTE